MKVHSFWHGTVGWENFFKGLSFCFQYLYVLITRLMANNILKTLTILYLKYAIYLHNKYILKDRFLE